MGGAHEISPPTRTRIVVVDDHALYRRGLDVVLASEEDLDVVGEAGSGPEAVALVREVAPDIVLMDVRMPGGDGVEACREIAGLELGTRVVMLTTSDDERDLVDSIRAGAVGYLLKDAPPEAIIAGIRQVRAGRSLLSPDLGATLLEEFAAMLREDSSEAALTHLTEREMQVLRIIAEGATNREISERLFISENTVKNHVRHILDKLQLHSRTEAALFAVQRRLGPA